MARCRSVGPYLFVYDRTRIGIAWVFVLPARSLRQVSGITNRIPFAAKSVVKIARARSFEFLGRDRYAYPALNRLDWQMLARLPRQGTFLEVGANDGYSQSNTYCLERNRGWRGILIEPLPGLYFICRMHRRRSTCFNVACVGPGAEPTLRLVEHGLRSVSRGLVSESEEARRVGKRRTVEVLTATMSDLIDRSSLGRITFMSIDVEGAELHVLSGLDLSRHCPDFLLVETSRIDDVDALLSKCMTRTDRLSHHDYLFERSQ